MKKMITIGVVLVGVVFLAGCGQQSAVQTQPTPVAEKSVQPESNKSTEDQPVSATSVDNIAKAVPADWKIYSDTTYGFSIQYPPTLLTEKNGIYKSETAAETIAFGKKETVNFGGKQTAFVTSEVSLEVLTKASDVKNVQNTIDSGKTNGNEGPQKTYAKITVGGMPALKVMGRGNTQSSDMDIVHIVKDGRAFVLTFNFAKVSPSFEESMIASFKFTK